jgi:ABC-type protease/lipase transport system fused ATPase/permease subunit
MCSTVQHTHTHTHIVRQTERERERQRQKQRDITDMRSKVETRENVLPMIFPLVPFYFIVIEHTHFALFLHAFLSWDL